LRKREHIEKKKEKRVAGKGKKDAFKMVGFEQKKKNS